MTAVGQDMPLCTEQAPLGAAAAGAEEPVRLQVALQLNQAEASIRAFAYRKVH
jgi:hypothetical protein